MATCDALIILLIGGFAGRIGGKIVSKVLDKIGVDEAVDKTIIGDTIKKSGMTTVGFFDALVRWFIYIIFIVAAVNVLNIPMLTDFMHRIGLYIPHLIAGIIVLVVGLILVNIVMNWVGEQLTSREVSYADIITPVLKALFSLVVIVLALDQLLIDTRIIYTFLVPLAWGLAAGIAIAIGISLGWGIKDIVAEYIKEKLKTNTTTGWVEVTKAIFNAYGMKIYYNDDRVSMKATMKIMSARSAETDFVDSPLENGMKKSLELYTVRKLPVVATKFVVEVGI
ncbi:MAG: hypothetical protein QMD80_06010 [archaeon]|nr:hypothetical protein [archaeon]